MSTESQWNINIQFPVSPSGDSSLKNLGKRGTPPRGPTAVTQVESMEADPGFFQSGSNEKI